MTTNLLFVNYGTPGQTLTMQRIHLHNLKLYAGMAFLVQKPASITVIVISDLKKGHDKLKANTQTVIVLEKHQLAKGLRRS